MDVTVSEILKRARAEAQEATAAREAAQARAATAIADADAAVEREKAALAVHAWVEQQAIAPAAPAEPAEPTGQAPASAATRFGRPVPEVTNTDLTLRVLEDLGRPASTTEIRERLAGDGHELSQTQVRSTLKYLARKPAYGVTTEPGSGVWRINRSALNGAGDRRAPAG
jgi:hypothetical protein